MGKFATKTSVSIARSRTEVEAILRRYGASGFRYGWYNEHEAMHEQVEFVAAGRLIRFTLRMPPKDARQFTHTPTGLRRTRESAVREWEQSCRQRWRALVLAIRAKLEAVESGISEFEEEFLAFIVDPATGRTVSETIRPQLAASYETRSGQPLLLSCDSRTSEDNHG